MRNSGFETGDFTDWISSAQDENVTIVNGVAYEGSYCLEINGESSVGQPISQTTTGNLTFWAKCSRSSDSSYIVIFFYGTDAYSITVGPISGIWNKYEVESSIAYDELLFSTTETDYPTIIYAE